MSYYGFPKYVSVAEKRAKAEKKLKQLKKKHPDISPVVITGKALATSWWGKAWNRNLEGYADYANRLERGRSYARHGAVLDLKVEAGNVTALVIGSEPYPYKVTVSIRAISVPKWLALKEAAVGTMDSVRDLMAGRLPDAMVDLLTEKGKGLFPAPKEISFTCSCPDSASMCKHVAASLYGVGARLDDDPSLLFLLRKVEVQDLITEKVNRTRGTLRRKAVKKSDRALKETGGLSDLFGIDLGEGEAPAPVPSAKVRKKAADKVGAGKRKSRAVPVKKAAPKGRPPGKGKTASNLPDAMTPSMKRLATLMQKKRNGVPVAEMIAASKMDPQKVRNTLYQMKQKGWVASPSRGVYRLVQVG
ncbi:hypothetical protein [Desulfoluna spongiiphila]|uniref:SWIM-type domain-containing protein n=1 Tax=Desulfoluna spongiiphila TaxID=419481 RepID=A0A1G5EZ16_9BACT|nr:hypothetical protein [Desulfoluna spongiiphila]SCY32265.1 hypothetical protein SAMN05216233_10713 [Desulfoluna spongiiphila]VVS94429.1 zinc finger swim-type [Desulfoluna spongiiphila]